MTSKIFIINGSAESGKDEVYKIFNQYYQGTNSRIFNISTIDKIRNLFSFYDIIEKTDNVRELMDKTKTGIEKINPYGINDSIVNECNSIFNKYHHNTDNLIVFIHCRESQNIEYLKKNLTMIAKTETMLIIRPDVINKFKNKRDNFENITAYHYDHIFYNRDLENFKQHIIKFIEMSNV